TSWQELDFDGVDAYRETPQLEAHIRKFFNLALSDRDEEDFRRNTLLQIRLRYWYEMKIPFANQIIFLAWYAANADVALYGAIDRSTTEKQNMLGRSGDSRGLRPRAKGIWDPSGKGYPPVTAREMGVLWDIATGVYPILGADRRFFIPLHATQSMRMQSSFYRKWLVHE
ncbi:MAG: pilus assembly protein, partial [Myxococcaceae bacterium]|nr:pilus assembly protein [Myxococcaceae bacterium]